MKWIPNEFLLGVSLSIHLLWRGVRQMLLPHKYDEFIWNEIIVCLIASICMRHAPNMPGSPKVGRLHAILPIPRYVCQIFILHSHAIHACINGFSSARHSISFDGLIEFLSMCAVYELQRCQSIQLKMHCHNLIFRWKKKKILNALFDVCQAVRNGFSMASFLIAGIILDRRDTKCQYLTALSLSHMRSTMHMMD